MHRSRAKLSASLENNRRHNQDLCFVGADGDLSLEQTGSGGLPNVDKVLSDTILLKEGQCVWISFGCAQPSGDIVQITVQSGDAEIDGYPIVNSMVISDVRSNYFVHSWGGCELLVKSSTPRINCVRSIITFRCLLEYIDAPVVLVLSNDNSLAVTMNNYKHTVFACDEVNELGFPAAGKKRTTLLVDLDFVYSSPRVISVYPMLSSVCVPPKSTTELSPSSTRMSFFVPDEMCDDNREHLSSEIICYLKQLISCQSHCVLTMNVRQDIGVILNVAKALGVTHIVSDSDDVCYGEAFRVLKRSMETCHLSHVPPLRSGSTLPTDARSSILSNIRLQHARMNCVLTELLSPAHMAVNTVWAAVEKSADGVIPVFWGYLYVDTPGVCYTTLSLDALQNLDIIYVMTLDGQTQNIRRTRMC